MFVAVVVLLLTTQVEKPAEVETPPAAAATPAAAPPVAEAPGVSPVGLFTAGAGVTFGAGYVLPTGGLTASLGARFGKWFGVVAIAHGRIGLLPTGDGSTHLYGLGAGVRIGGRTHVMLGASPTIAVFETPNLTKTGVGASIIANLVLGLGEFTAILLQPVLDFANGQVLGSVTLGAGVTF
ncbi:MAG: hypothetical protein QM817_27155 [Archangium sp.]